MIVEIRVALARHGIVKNLDLKFAVQDLRNVVDQVIVVSILIFALLLG